ncbi:MAG: Zn-ribbon domain-containing OB-fold protein [Acidimicrobiales bacterium]
MSAARPVPPANPSTEPYWEAARRHELALQRCDVCGTRPFPPRATCPSCGSRALSWSPVSGRGTVHTFTVAYRAPHPGFADRLPLVVALVDLDEGPRLTTNIVGCAPADVHIGLPVEVAFDNVDGTEVTLPVFRPREG